MKLRARAVVEGVLSGLHKSPHQGQSVEFAEHKEYAPGDELRHLDWKAYGKFDRYYVKRFEHETNLRAFLVVDALGVDGLPRRAALQARGAPRTLAGALAYLLVRQQDAVGLSVVTRAGRGRRASRAPPPGTCTPCSTRWTGCSPRAATDLFAAADAPGRARRAAGSW